METPTKAELEQENKELKKENNRLKMELSKLGNTLEELLEENKALKKLKNVRIHNARGAGRKKDTHLEVHILACWAKEMKDNEIIGSEYDGFNGKKKVSRASYYRVKKRLYQN